MGVRDGAGVGARVGYGVRHVPLMQSPLQQSTAFPQPSSSWHAGQLPPQSTSLSSPSCRSLVQPTSVGLGVGGNDGRGVGPGVSQRSVGTSDGTGVGAGVVGEGDGTYVGLGIGSGVGSDEIDGSGVGSDDGSGVGALVPAATVVMLTAASDVTFAALASATRALSSEPSETATASALASSVAYSRGAPDSSPP